jgi:hypothetical protein
MRIETKPLLDDTAILYRPYDFISPLINDHNYRQVIAEVLKDKETAKAWRKWKILDCEGGDDVRFGGLTFAAASEKLDAEAVGDESTSVTELAVYLFAMLLESYQHHSDDGEVLERFICHVLRATAIDTSGLPLQQICKALTITRFDEAEDTSLEGVWVRIDTEQCFTMSLTDVGRCLKKALNATGDSFVPVSWFEMYD